MNKKKIAVLEFAFQLLAFLLLLFRMFYWERWLHSTLSGDRPELRYSANFFTAADNTYSIFAYVIPALMIANLVLIFLYVYKSVKPNIAHIIIPVVEIVGLIVFSILAGIEKNNYRAQTTGIFYFEIFILLIVVVLALIRCSKIIKDEPAKANEVSNTATDELNK